MSTSVKLPLDIKGLHIHFVGIKGTGMAALVEILVKRGAIITGSDVSERFYTDEVLEKAGIKALEFSEKNITNDIDYVIYSSAYSVSKNPDLIEASKKRLPMMLYTQALGCISELSYSCGICGVHGKTTTTGLTGTLLKAVDLPSQALAGSIISSFDNSCTMTTPSFSKSDNHYFIAETCEYQRHFMDFEPKKIILTSVESDHQDYYPTYQDILDAFVDYILKLPLGGDLIYCADDKGAVEAALIAKQKRPDINLIPYGECAEGEWQIKIQKSENGLNHFTVGSLGDFALCVPGNHSIRNATAALALVCQLIRNEGLNINDFKQKLYDGLLKFRGGKRRCEITGEATLKNEKKVIFIDDYGHHPTAIKTTLAGIKDFYAGYKIIVDFMSHTYTRTQALLEEFASSFESADCVIINKIYGSARENPSDSTVTGEILAEHAQSYHKNVYYCEEFDEAALKGYELLSNACENCEGYIFVTMGAGDNWKVGQKILQMIKNN